MIDMLLYFLFLPLAIFRFVVKKHFLFVKRFYVKVYTYKLYINISCK